MYSAEWQGRADGWESVFRRELGGRGGLLGRGRKKGNPWGRLVERESNGFLVFRMKVSEESRDFRRLSFNCGEPLVGSHWFFRTCIPNVDYGLRLEQGGTE